MRDKEERSRSLLAGLFLSAINLIPLSGRIFLFESLSRLFYALDGRHRRIAHRNLALAFPEKDPKERKAIARSALRNLARAMAEFSYTPRLNEKNINQHIIMEGLDHFQQAYEKRKGILFFTAHFGNWEWMTFSLPLLTHHTCHFVYRLFDSRFIEGIVERLRTRMGNQTVPKQKAMRRVLQLLNKGEIVWILLDQNVAWQEGVFVNFFGELACTTTGMALLALKTGAAVLPAFSIRQKDGRYKVIIEPEVSLIRTGNKDLDVSKNTELFTQIIERYIRNHPDHWLWVHQRWKTRPWQSKQYRNSKS